MQGKLQPGSVAGQAQRSRQRQVPQGLGEVAGPGNESRRRDRARWNESRHAVGPEATDQCVGETAAAVQLQGEIEATRDCAAEEVVQFAPGVYLFGQARRPREREEFVDQVGKAL